MSGDPRKRRDGRREGNGAVAGAPAWQPHFPAHGPWRVRVALAGTTAIVTTPVPGLAPPQPLRAPGRSMVAVLAVSGRRCHPRHPTGGLGSPATPRAWGSGLRARWGAPGTAVRAVGAATGCEGADPRHSSSATRPSRGGRSLRARGHTGAARGRLVGRCSQLLRLVVAGRHRKVGRREAGSHAVGPSPGPPRQAVALSGSPCESVLPCADGRPLPLSFPRACGLSSCTPPPARAGVGDEHPKLKTRPRAKVPRRAVPRGCRPSRGPWFCRDGDGWSLLCAPPLPAGGPVHIDLRGDLARHTKHVLGDPRLSYLMAGRAGSGGRTRPGVL